MRRSLSLIAILALLASEATQACRPYFWSPKQTAQEASSIFIAEVVGKRSQGAGADMLDLKIMEILKGAVPGTITTASNNIRAFGDGCTAVDTPGWKRTISIGEKWLIAGSNTQDGKFMPYGTAFPYEPKSKYLNDLRKALKQLEKQKK